MKHIDIVLLRLTYCYCLHVYLTQQKQILQSLIIYDMQLSHCSRGAVVCTCLCNANVEDGSSVFLWKVLRGRLEAQCAIILFHHFEDSNGISIRQPGDERPKSAR